MNYFKNLAKFGLLISFLSSLVIFTSILSQAQNSDSQSLSQPVLSSAINFNLSSSGNFSGNSLASANNSSTLPDSGMIPTIPNAPASVSPIPGNSLSSSSSSVSSSSSSSVVIASENQVSTQKITGELLSIEGNILTLSTGDQSAKFQIPQNVKLTRNSVNAQLSDLKPRDQITITQGADNQILSVEALPAGEAADAAKFLIPGLILLLLVLGLLFYFWKKSQKGSIKTTPTNLGS